jgi:CelD/BcsL family acetyltransferase involved in cellulose biosynthesis
MKWSFFPVSEFAQHRETWQALNNQSANTPLLDGDFIEPLIIEFANGRERLAVGETETGVQAMAILTRHRPGTWQTFQPSQAPLGAWVAAASLSWKPVLQSLVAALPGMPFVVGVTQQDPDVASRPEDGGTVRTLDYIQTARITVNGGFAEYWATRGKNLRHNMKRQRNRLERDGIVTRLELFSDASDVKTAIEDYGRLESVGWKSDTGTAIHPGNAQGHFYAEMLERFARIGACRIYRYWYGDKLVAMDLCIQRNGVLVILKTTYDESQSASSPAFLMRQESFERIFAEGTVKKIEFYGKLMDWHTKWSDEVRTLYHVNCYRWAFLPAVLR